MPRLKDRKAGVPELGNALLLEKRKAEKALKVAKKLEKERIKSGYKYVVTANKTRKLMKFKKNG